MSSVKFNKVYLDSHFVIGGPKEKNGKLDNFDLTMDDYYFHAKTFEKSEANMQALVIENLLINKKYKESDIDFLIGGDLLNQICATSYSARNFKIPFIGVYAACATFPLSIFHGASLIESDNAQNVICITSSHGLSAERQYRYPVEYGNTKPNTATCTATGAVGVILTKQKTKMQIKAATIGKTIDMGIKDVNHMGAVMAPACADTIYTHLQNMKKRATDYDVILTGDLGKVGVNILKEYYEKVYGSKLLNVIDAGSSIYLESQNMYAGGSGPVCLPMVLVCKILQNPRYHKILVVGTGSLHTPVLINQNETIPSVAHAVEIEVLS